MSLGTITSSGATRPSRTTAAAGYVMKARRTIAFVSGALSGLATVGLLVAMLTEIISRGIFGSPTSWAFEYSGYLVAAGAFLGAAYANKSGGLVRVTVLTEHFSPKLQRIVYLLGDVVSFGVLVVLAFIVTDFFSDTLADGRLANTPTLTPLAYPMATMIIGIWLLCLDSFLGLFEQPEPPTDEIPGSI
jgi:TRAP-type C4-dicarboxylate transport system permease small subunit